MNPKILIVYSKIVYPLLFILLVLGISLSLEGCEDCQMKSTYIYYEPVYTPLEEVRAAVQLESPRAIASPGRLYFKDGYLFINEVGKGLHIIDNRDPSAPVNLKFLAIPGNYDLAIQGNTLYADSYIDLVSFDISDLQQIKEVDRQLGAFKSYNLFDYFQPEACCVITDLVEKENVSELPCEVQFQPWGGVFFREGIALTADGAKNFSAPQALAPGGMNTGIGGSLARFTIVNHYLYMLDGGEIQTADISLENSPELLNRTYVSWDIETIFPHGTNLFIGSRSGMHIYDLTDPSQPAPVSVYSHVVSCDPVIVDDQYAFVTLRSEGLNRCQNAVNQLEIIDISSLQSPTLVKTYPMVNPHGLGKDGSTLFICDGEAGLKVYNAENVMTLDQNLLYQFKNLDALDVIPFQSVLMLIGVDGIYQYDYSDPNNMKLLSILNIVHAN